MNSLSEYILEKFKITKNIKNDGFDFDEVKSIIDIGINKKNDSSEDEYKITSYNVEYEEEPTPESAFHDKLYKIKITDIKIKNQFKGLLTSFARSICYEFEENEKYDWTSRNDDNRNIEINIYEKNR